MLSWHSFGSAPSHPSLHLPCSNISQVYVVMGATQLTLPGPGAQVRYIKQLRVHQYYDQPNKKNDIALLELNEPVLCSPYIQLACVPDITLRVSELVHCFVAGWGNTVEGGEFPRRIHVLRASSASWGDRLGFPQQRPKPDSGCRTYVPGDMSLALTRSHTARTKHCRDSPDAKPCPRDRDQPHAGQENW